TPRKNGYQCALTAIGLGFLRLCMRKMLVS
ncbi:hypothetical protein BMETH_1353677768835, partial [methanotrophic bacterial endosymbiont of Bathymodiolus sp.]